MRKNKISDRVIEISKNIADGYLKDEDVLEIIEEENGRLYLYVDGEIKEYDELDPEVDPSDIDGYLFGKIYDTFEYMNEDTMYAESLKDSTYDHESIFPLANMKSISVVEEKQGQGMGTQMMSYAIMKAGENDHFPIISRIWKKANGENDHIETAKELGGEVIAEDEWFLDHLECNICGTRECDCSAVFVIFDI